MLSSYVYNSASVLVSAMFLLLYSTIKVKQYDKYYKPCNQYSYVLWNI